MQCNVYDIVGYDLSIVVLYICFSSIFEPLILNGRANCVQASFVTMLEALAATVLCLCLPVFLSFLYCSRRTSMTDDVKVI